MVKGGGGSVGNFEDLITFSRYPKILYGDTRKESGSFQSRFPRRSLMGIWNRPVSESLSGTKTMVDCTRSASGGMSRKRVKILRDLS